MDWLGRGAAKREFEAFVKDTSDDLVRTAYMLTFDFARAEDLVQEAYLRVARRWDRVRSMEHPAAYARRALVNLTLQGSKKRLRQRDELGSGEVLACVVDASALRALSAVEDVAEFRSALAELPERQRAVLVLRYWAGLPEAEVAAALGCSVGTVKSTASRAASRVARAMSGGTSVDGSSPRSRAVPPGPPSSTRDTERAIT
jgi:RNA polymerase sigma-70 factor (sigma-E family)